MSTIYGPTFCCRAPSERDPQYDDKWWYDTSKEEWWLSWKGQWLNMHESFHERALLKSNMLVIPFDLNKTTTLYRDFLIEKEDDMRKPVFEIKFIKDKTMSCNREKNNKNLNSLIDFEKFESVWTDFLEKYAAEEEYFDINEDYEFNDLEKTVLKAIAERFHDAMEELEG
jgi:hypothetical protein